MVSGRYASVTGGFLMNLVPSMQCSGSLNAWGTMSLYILSYYYLSDHSVSFDLFFVVFVLWCVCDGPGMCEAYPDLADLLYRRYGVRWTTLFAGGLLCSGYLLSSFITNPYLFLAVFGIVSGVGEGMTIVTPLYNVWKVFPHSKGRVSGAVILGYGCGPPLFGLVFTFLVNPQNDAATVHVRNGQASYYLFPRSVADNVPAAMRWMALICCVIYIIAILIQTDYRRVETTTPHDTRVSLGKGLRTWSFWRLIVGLSLSRCFGLFLLNVYKALGEKFYSDDQTLSALGSTVTAMGAIGRIVLPTAADYVSFRFAMTVSLLIQIAVALTLWLIASQQVLYGAWISAAMLVSGGYLPVFALECSASFGPA